MFPVWFMAQKPAAAVASGHGERLDRHAGASHSASSGSFHPIRNLLNTGVWQMNRRCTFVAAALFSLATPAFAETIGFSQVGSESGWRTAFSADMLQEARSRGIDLHFDAADGSVERQIA